MDTTAIHKNAVIAVLACCAGFVGSAVRGWIDKIPETIRAERFEVIDTSGNVVSSWGPDNRPGIPASTPKGTLLTFMNAKGQRGCELGSESGSQGPTLSFYDRDGVRRVGLSLTMGDDPILGLSGSKIERAVILGAIKGDVWIDRPGNSWGLTLRSGKAESTIGAVEPGGGTHWAGVQVKDEKGRYWNFPPATERR
jgi:hypothetical protein